MEPKEPREIVVSKKHFTLRVIGFVVALGVGLGAIGYGVYQIVVKKPGLYTINARVEKDLPYAPGVVGEFYFKEGDINGLVNGATDLLSTSLRYSYMRCDEWNIYKECPSIAMVNYNLDADVTVDGIVYDILKDAYAKTLEKKNFSLFAGPLYEDWEHRCTFPLHDAIEDDPLRNVTTAEYLAKAASYVNDLSNFQLTFKEGNVVRLSISESYAKFRNDYGITYPILTLNALHSAYKTQAVVDEFAKAGIYHGVIYDNEGDYAFLTPTYQNVMNLYDVTPTSIARFGTLSNQESAALSIVHHFPVIEGQYNPGYRFSQGESLILRSTHLNLATGVSNKAFATSLYYEKGSTSIVNARYANNGLGAYDSLEGVKAAMGSNHAVLGVMNKEVVVGSAVKSTLTVEPAYTIVEKA